MLQNIVGRASGQVRTTLGTLRAPSVGAKPTTTEFKITMTGSGTGITFRAASYVNGDFNLATYYTVQAQEEATFGHGQAELPDNQGYMYLQYQTTAPAAIDGPVRLLLEDAHGTAIGGAWCCKRKALAWTPPKRTAGYRCPPEVARMGD